MNSPLANVSATRAVLERHGLWTKHHLGQNFLVNDDVIGKILGLAELGPSDVVLEVGPGIGTLSVALLGSAGAVVAVEADRSLAPVLAETCGGVDEGFSLVLGDALKVGEDDLSEAVAALGRDDLPTMPTAFVSNLPYQVAATLILRTLEELPSVRRIVVMVQAEVAGRIAATPGGREYGAYTAKLGLYGHVTGRFNVSPGNFFPPPHVDSAVVRIERRELVDEASGEALAPELREATTRVIDAAFAQRRKTIRNSMGSSGFDKAALDAAFAATGIDARCRAETLATADFVRLAQALSV